MESQTSKFFTEIEIRTTKHSQLLGVSDLIEKEIQRKGWSDGLLHVFVPHTTAAVTIQEDADPDVQKDILYVLDKIIPWEDYSYAHTEGNSAAHVKSALLGNSLHCNIVGGRLKLGTWQGVFLCEFDGPRTRKIQLSFIPFS
ncbi:secondary thiamine-phosphate synthase enzyme YjbQ [Candidatus Methylacidiphilum infernorum]|uniref:secondary thiamine-phosphate synthase enzyme YjbQ n=1 Tax=Candidatus Methylacidiphilum infernorum TaxID=511746 RepID=UPI000662323F|nr:secondary thiamine-phosphate synthase enzyme YjbQ [Candidatus Methylacidiphilum infernorum]